MDQQSLNGFEIIVNLEIKIREIILQDRRFQNGDKFTAILYIISFQDNPNLCIVCNPALNYVLYNLKFFT